MPYRIRLHPVSFLVALVFTTACSKPKSVIVVPASPNPSAATATATARIAPDDFACGLLTKEEVQAVQGEPFTNTRPSSHSVAGVINSQCYFETAVPVNSIVLTVTRKADGGRDPRDNWKEIFHGEKSAGEKEEREEARKPLKVDGVGDEAFWTGTRVGGALYVLKGNCYIRISIGGAGDQEQKIEKSKRLAEAAFKRL